MLADLLLLKCSFSVVNFVFTGSSLFFVLSGAVSLLVLYRPLLHCSFRVRRCIVALYVIASLSLLILLVVAIPFSSLLVVYIIGDRTLCCLQLYHCSFWIGSFVIADCVFAALPLLMVFVLFFYCSLCCMQLYNCSLSNGRLIIARCIVPNLPSVILCWQSYYCAMCCMQLCQYCLCNGSFMITQCVVCSCQLFQISSCWDINIIVLLVTTTMLIAL